MMFNAIEIFVRAYVAACLCIALTVTLAAPFAVGAGILYGLWKFAALVIN